jgi:hypothetical protein
MMITGAQRDLRASFLIYLAGLIVCMLTYMLALLVFFVVVGFSPGWFGFRPSSNFDQFGMDIVLGLLAAAIFAAAGIAVFAFVLTGRWSNTLLLRLLFAGLITIIITFIVNYSFRSYWSFYGALLPLGNALFCYLVGTHIWQHQEGQVAATAREPHQMSPPA